ncbi:MAG: T9SS type A sorting domain-containing protein [Calditrichaceae bacterium]|nr:T9SS type A sorting domain-containing protein [Calditrichaceae bacterium]
MQTKKLIFIMILICITSQTLYGQYKEFMYGDSIRTYAVYEPELDPNPDGYPLVIALHGAGSEDYVMIATAGLILKANTEKFIVASPNSLRYNLLTWWNAGGIYEGITGGTDDLGFISALIDTMIENYNVDETRIYVMGFSNGAAMAYRVAAELSPKIAAMGVSSGQMLYEYCNPEFPVPIIHFHGLSDDTFPYYGSSDSAQSIPPVDTTIAIWRGINNCSEIPDTIFNENGIIGRKWASSTGLSDIILYTNPEGEHDWPRPANWGISATDLIWDFLKVHERNNIPNLAAKRFIYDDEMRTYLVYAPPENLGPRPLLIGLHCHTGTATGLLTYTDLLQKVRDENVIGVFPNGLMHPIGTAWNVGSSFEKFTRGTDDVGFISALIDTIIRNYDVDTTRIYATGHSNGSMMSYRLAAELSHRIAAIGCVAAPMLYEYPDPEYSVPIIHFHGLSDTTMPYEGKVEQFCTYPHMDTTLTIWRDLNDCSSTPEIIKDENGIIGKKWPSSDGKGDIILYTIETCMHDWPVYDKYGISATDEIWDYLKLHHRFGVPTSKQELDLTSIPLDFQLYQNFPNPFNPSTSIKYQLNKSSHITLKIFNLAGQEIETLTDEFQSAGQYEITWHAKGFPSGLYFYNIQIGKFSERKKMILLK